MKIYCDMEFTGLRKDTNLISIGIVANDGRVFYAESNEYSLDNTTDVDRIWLQDNVVPYLIYSSDKESFIGGNFESDIKLIPNQMEYLMKGTLEQIGSALRVWLNKYEEVTFVGDVLAYDWILFCDILGETAKDIPSHVSYTPIDIATLMYAVDLDPMDITRAKFVDVQDIDQGKVWQKQHNALYDALVIKKSYEKLMNKIKVMTKSTKVLDGIIQKMESTDMSNHIIIPEVEMHEIKQILTFKNITKER